MGDIIRVQFNNIGTADFPLELNGLTWPPPQFLTIDLSDDIRVRKSTPGDDQHLIFQRIRMSKLTDEQVAGCERAVRIAQYRYKISINPNQKERQHDAHESNRS